MEKIIFLFVTICFLSISNLTQAQKAYIWLMNGEKVPINNYSLSTSDSTNQFIKTVTILGKQKIYYTDDVFSIVNKDNSEKYFYKPQPESGETLEITQMKSYVLGLNQSIQTQPNSLMLVGSFSSGLIGALIPPTSIKGSSIEGAFPTGILIPIAFVSIGGYFSLNHSTMYSAAQKNDNQYFLMGFEEGLKKKTILYNAISGCLGFISGYIINSKLN